ncbi:hypothetical protein BC937DRAFT_95447 [Endogone sp. FLAS-F59071]|nr:hypothetical protein BC937DRAFT_95447 [Endogone sp. FLAS-F59071]|eukprot:RUS13348.1 hypothetical protein BC937DRAFT_95447 [Endogone sp. FLAS-F59071]
MVFKSRYPDVELPRTGIVQYIFSNHYGTPDNKPVLIDDIGGRSITFGELRSLVGRFAASLKDNLNFKRGEVLCLFSPNVIDYSVPMFGTIAAGKSLAASRDQLSIRGVISPANPSYNEMELTYQLQEAHATIMIISPDSIDVAVKAAKTVGIPKDRIFLFGDKTVGGLKPYLNILGKREAKPVEYTFEEASTTTAFLCFSSGTTGRSKGVETT